MIESRPADAAFDTLIESLLCLPEDQQDAVLQANGCPPMELVRALKERSFALLAQSAPRALALAQLAQHIAARTDSLPTQALAARGLAQALHALGQYDLALPCYEGAFDGFSRAGDALEAARSLIGKVDVLMYVGRYDDAVETARTARLALMALGDRRRAARLDMNLGNVFHRLDRPVAALAAYEQAREALRGCGDDMDVAVVEQNRANVLASLNRFGDALAAYAAAKTTYLANGQHVLHARTSYNEAYLHFLLGHYGRALAEFARLRPTFRQLDDQRHLALCDLDEAEVLLALNRPHLAGELAGRAAEVFASLGMRYEQSKAQAFVAVAAIEGGEYQGARHMLAQAAAGFERESNVLWMATVRLLHAELDLRRGAALEAASSCDTALALLAPLARTSRGGHAHLLRGRALRRLGRAAAARQDAQTACDLALTLGDRVLSYQALHLCGQLQEEVGDLDGAAASYAAAIQDVEQLRGGLAQDELRISFVRDKVGLYEDAVRIHLRRHRTAEAFEYVERAKARALVDLLAEEPSIRIHAEDEDRRLAARVEELRSELTALYTRLHGDGEGRQRFAAGQEDLFEQMQRCEREIADALSQLQLRQADYVSLRAATVVHLDDVRQCLGPRDVLLEYYLIDGDILAFVVTRDTVHAHGPLASSAEIEDLAQRWRYHLAHFRHGPAFVLRHGARLRATALALLGVLHDRLIAPLASHLDDCALLIVPHGPLHHVPFQALYDGRTFLIERHDLSYAPSASTLVVQRVRQPASDRALVVGLPSPALPHIREEVEAVALRQQCSEMLLGDLASRAAFLAAVPRCRRLHLATHAMFRPDNPLFSAVQLADDWLTVADIYNLELAAELVVLSACDTGAGTVLYGDEVLGFLRGFLYAGAHTLVASQWAASDAATAALMAAFYERLASGEDVRHALRLAQCAALTRHLHPYYWAPFMVYGRTNPSQRFPV